MKGLLEKKGWGGFWFDMFRFREGNCLYCLNGLNCLNCLNCLKGAWMIEKMWGSKWKFIPGNPRIVYQVKSFLFRIKMDPLHLVPELSKKASPHHLLAVQSFFITFIIIYKPKNCSKKTLASDLILVFFAVTI